MPTSRADFSRSVVILAGAVLSLSGCDTGVWNRTDKSDEVSAQKQGIEATASLSRFNFEFGVTLNVKDSGPNPASFHLAGVSLMRPVNGKDLPLKEYKFMTNGTSKDVPKEQSDLTLSKNEAVTIRYRFDGSPVMGWAHFIQTDARKILRLEVSGISRNDHAIPIEFTFKEP